MCRLPFGLDTVHERGGQKPNEDALLVGEKIFGVFDGSTSLTGYADAVGDTGGKIAAQIACSAFEEKDIPLQGRALRANDLIRDAMRNHSINTDTREALWSTSGAAVSFVGDMIQFFHVGDCFILCLNTDGAYWFLAEPHNHDVELLRMWRSRIAGGMKKASEIRKSLMDQIVKVRRQANETYGVLNGDEKARNFFTVGPVPFKNINTVILSTDGLLIPRSDPDSPDAWGQFVELYGRGGLRCIADFVRSLEQSDPECLTYIRPKPHDDIGAIAIQIHGT
jgi:serine/threonine protein phosphatase PrpC